MATETLGASFSIDVTSLKAGLAQANRLIRESESEFKAAAAGMDKWTDSQEGLEARIKHLNTAADLQRKKVDALQSEYDRLIADGLDPTSAAAVKLRTDINKEKEALAKTEKELKNQKDALEAMGDAAEEAADAIEDTGDAAEDAGDGFTVANGAIATFIGNGLSSLVGACKDAIGTVLGLAESTKEYRTIMASLENSSKAAGYTVAETEASFKQLNGVLGDTQAAATTTANLQAIGLEQGKLQELTDGVIGAWARYGDSIPIDGLGEAINHTISLGEVQGNLADVIEWGGGNVDEFNERLSKCTTEAERAEEIQKLLAEQGLTESGKAWQENNKSVVEANNAQAKLDETTAELGEKIEPLTTKFTDLKTKALQWFIDTGLPAIKTGFGWLKDNLPTVAVVVGGLTAAMLAQKVANLANKAALEGMTIAQYAAKIAQDGLNKAMKANAVGLIVTAITALIATFMQLWQNCEGFREFWIGLWEGIKTACSVVIEWIGGAFSAAWDAIVSVWNGAGEFFSGLWQGIEDAFSSCITFFEDLFSDAWQGIKDAFSGVGEFFGGIWDTIVGTFETIGTKVAEAIGGAFKTAINAVISTVEGAINLVPKAINGAISLINKLPGVEISKIPTVELPRLATGGVVNKATAAVIGEDGAEAVIPLEKNTGWIKKLAKEIAAEQGSGIVVNQTNNFKQAYESPLEKYKAKQELFAAARMIKAGAY